MSVYELIRRRRSIRRFQQKRIPRDELRRIVDAGRLAPSAMNMQPLEFIIVDEPEKTAALFELTNWAGYLPREQGRPSAGQEPVAFIAVLINNRLASKWTHHDVGAAVENMILTALEAGIGSCWIGSVNRPQAAELLAVPPDFEIDSLLALGYPAEEPVAFDLQDSVKYYRDAEGRLHVPKRRLESVLSINEFGCR